MKQQRQQFRSKRRGSILALTVILVIVLTLTGAALLKVAHGQLMQAVRVKNQEAAFSAAEAAYERAAFWMSQQVDMLNSLEKSQASGTLDFGNSTSDYAITFSTFLGARPVYRIEANGYCGIFQHTIQAYVVQAVSGWDLAMCRCPSGSNSTIALSFVTGDILDIPMHVNDLKDGPDNRDVYISCSPRFLSHVSMGESRYTAGGSDKYSSVMGRFEGGISFSQPASLIANADSVNQRVNRFRTYTHPSYQFTPTVSHTLPKHSRGTTGFRNEVSEQPAVHMKFYVKDGQGYVRVYDNSTVAAYTRGGGDSSTYDYRINPGSGSKYIKYPIYGCHFNSGTYTDIRIDDPTSPIYVTQEFGGVQSRPGAQIFVDGNVVIGAAQEDMAVLGSMINTVKGQLSVVATGNIWIANTLEVYGTRQADNMPTLDNPNILGLISQGVIKVVDPGMTTNGLLYNPSFFNVSTLPGYSPIGNSGGSQLFNRRLPGTVVVEAAMTIGGGGWGAENLYRNSSYPGRKNFKTSAQDRLVVRGSITEALRGIIGSGNNGFVRSYLYDKRVAGGIVPGNIWLKGKYVVIPGGWSESSAIRGIHQQ